MAVFRSYRKLSFAGFSLGLLLAVLFVGRAHAAVGCTPPSPNYGIDTISNITVPQDGTYRIWTRMAQISAGNNSYMLEVKGSDASAICFTAVGGLNLPATWNPDSSNWVDYHDGVDDASHKVSFAMHPGITYTARLIGTKPDLEIDNLIFTTITSGSNSCSPPSGTGALCSNNHAPTVQIQSPSAPGAHLSSSSEVLKAKVTDADGNLTANPIAFKDEFNGVTTTIPGAIQSLGSGVYQLNWDVTNVPAGSHILHFVATDDLQAVTDQTINVTVVDNAAVSINGNLADGDIMTGSNKNVSALVSGTTHATQVDFIITGPTNKTVSDTTPANFCLSEDGSGNCTFFNSTVLTDSPTDAHAYSIKAKLYYDRGSQHLTVTSPTPDITFGVCNSGTVAHPCDTQPTNPTNLRSTGQTASTISLVWDASSDDHPPLRGYIVQRSTNPTDPNGWVTIPSTANTTTPSTALTSYTDSDSALVCNTLYSYRVEAVDSIGQTSPGFTPPLSPPVSLKCPINHPPTTPGTPSAAATACNNINLSWGASTDPDAGDSVDHYTLMRNDGQTFDNIKTTAYSDVSVAGNTTYTYKAEAWDTHHANSAWSAESSPVTTPHCPQQGGHPSDVSNVRVAAIGQSSVTICWDPATETDGTLGGYTVYRDQQPLTPTVAAGTSPLCFMDGTRNSYANYHYQVEAFDSIDHSHVSPDRLPLAPGLSTHTTACGLGNVNCDFLSDGSGYNQVDSTDSSLIVGNYSDPKKFSNIICTMVVTHGRPDCHADFTGDFQVVSNDFSIMVGHWCHAPADEGVNTLCSK